MTGVTHLTFHTKILCDATPLQIPFQLTRLVLGGSYFPLAFTKALFAASVDSLVDLVLTLQQTHSPALREEINRGVGTLQNLRTLSDWCRTSAEFIDLCPYLPASLETINTCWPDKHRLTSLARAFDLNALPKLTNLRLTYLTRDEVTGAADGLKLLKTCERRGVEVTFGFEKDYLREEVRRSCLALD